MNLPPLKLLHSESALVKSKLEVFRKMGTPEIVTSLGTHQSNPLTAKADGTVMEGNHRVFVLRERGFDVDSLPRVAYKGA